MADIPNGWKKVDETLVLEVKLEDFSKAVEMVNKIAEIAEELNHHPNIEIKNYNELKVTTTTHSEEKLTDKDGELAGRVSELL